MVKVTDKNRDSIIETYVNTIIDGMDINSLADLLYGLLIDKKDLMSNESLEQEINEFYPELLETNNV